MFQVVDIEKEASTCLRSLEMFHKEITVTKSIHPNIHEQHYLILKAKYEFFGITLQVMQHTKLVLSVKEITHVVV